jgi:ribosome-binding factor A
METTRQQKIARLIQKELGTWFQRHARDLSGNALITPTKVYISKDIAFAKVYLSLFTPGDKQQLLEQIRKHTREIRFQLGRDLHNSLRIIPELQFFEDDSLDYLEKIEELLK